MNLAGKNVGVAITGSFCTFEKMFIELQNLADCGANIYPILSVSAQTIKSRFGEPDSYIERIKEITGREPITTIEGAEPIGPKHYLDVFILVVKLDNLLLLTILIHL